MSTPSEQLTLVKEGVQSNRLIVREAPLHIVRLRVVDHELEVRFELKPVLVLPLLQLRDRKSTRLNSSHSGESRMPSSA